MDTNYLEFSYKEKFFISTQNFVADQTTTPGRVLTITADPIGSMIQKSDKDSKLYASELAITLSRFRDFLYIGTEFQLVPAAKSESVDPAHISETLGGSQNYMNPIDVQNCIHYRRWLGGDFVVPFVEPSGASKKYTKSDALALDVAWLNDTRFNHVQVSEGFGFESVPMEADVVTGASATDSVFGYYYQNSIAAESSISSTDRQIQGQTMLRGGDIHRRGWCANPFAGFIYANEVESGQEYSEMDPACSDYYISDVNPNFPWFSDLVGSGVLTGLKDTIYDRVHESYMNPLCILRLPPAYGSRYYWTGYMRHHFAVRAPYIVNGTWTAGKIKVADYDSANPAQRSKISPAAAAKVIPLMRDPCESDGMEFGVFHAAPTDPYEYQSEIALLASDDDDLKARLDISRAATIEDVLDILRKGKLAPVPGQAPEDQSDESEVKI